MLTKELAGVLLSAVLLLGAPGGSLPATAGEVPEAAMAEAKQIYQSRCVLCHGETGKGDGPGAAALEPKPRDLGDAEWQKKATNEHIEKVIWLGGPGVGQSPLMPPNPDLKDKPGVIEGLREIVRGFGEK